MVGVRVPVMSGHLLEIRRLMQSREPTLDAYIIPTDDAHQASVCYYIYVTCMFCILE